MMFKKKKIKSDDRVETRFQQVVDLIRDLDKKEFNRLLEGITLAWQAYNKVSQAKTSYEKEVEDIESIEKNMEKEVDG